MLTPKALIPYIDLTRLNEDDTPSHIIALCKAAETQYGSVAAVCVLPSFVKLAKQQLSSSDVAVATVVNFPKGDQPVLVVKEEIKAALISGATEIDVVLPYFLIQQGDAAAALAFVQACRQACGNAIVLKVILETGVLNAQQIAEAALVAMTGGANFIKTSTGKVPQGATEEAVRIILDIIKKHPEYAVGVKISGGVRTVAQAQAFVQLVSEMLGEAWLSPQKFRLGSSQLLEQILMT